MRGFTLQTNECGLHWRGSDVETGHRTGFETLRIARWVYRLHDMHMSTPFSNFAECRTDKGCRAIIKLETINANDA